MKTVLTKLQDRCLIDVNARVAEVLRQVSEKKNKSCEILTHEEETVLTTSDKITTRII